MRELQKQTHNSIAQVFEGKPNAMVFVDDNIIWNNIFLIIHIRILFSVNSAKSDFEMIITYNHICEFIHKRILFSVKFVERFSKNRPDCPNIYADMNSLNAKNVRIHLLVRML